MLQPGVAFSFRTVQHPEGSLVLLEIPAATSAPVEFDKTAYFRIGSATPRLADHPERQRALWNCLRPYMWEAGVTRHFVNAEDVLSLLDYPSYFELLDRPTPESTKGILESLESERLISHDVGGKWNIHNLGAILLANDMGEFESRLARKAMRFVAYDGHGRAATVTHRMDFPLGYASGLARLDVRINTLIPSPEEGSATERARI